jgi:O-antigen/teichoic acid export membrane protein
MSAFSPRWRNIVSSLLLIAANAGFGLLTFALNLVVANRLGAAAYGSFVAIVGVITLLSAVFPALVMGVAKSVTLQLGRDPGAGWSVFADSARRTAWGAVPFVILALALTRPASRFLRLEDPAILLVALLFIVASLLLSLGRGALEGCQLFGSLAANVGLEGLLRFVLGFLFVLWLASVRAVIWAYVLAALLPVLPIVHQLGRRRSGSMEPARMNLSRELWAMLAGQGLIEVVANADMIAVKHFLPAQQAGLYAVLFSAGKFVLFAANAITTVMFPQVVEAVRRGERSLRVILETGLLLTGICAAFVIFSALGGSFVILLLFGSEYLPAAPLLGPYTAGILFLSLSLFIVRYLMAKGWYSFLGVLLLGAGAEIAALAAWHADTRQVVLVFIAVNVAILAALLLVTAGCRRRHNNQVAVVPAPAAVELGPAEDAGATEGS